MRPKFNTNKRNFETLKDNIKHLDPKNENLPIKRPCKRYDHCKIDDDVEVLSRNLLKINFSSKDPRPGKWNPKDPLLITSCICQNQIHSVHIDNGRSTDIVYEHCFQQLLSS